MKQTFDFDPNTKIARTNVWSVGYLSNENLAKADLIIGRGDKILKDKIGGRIGLRCSAEIIAEYERAAA